MYSLIDNHYTLSRGRLLCRVFHIFRRERNIFCFVPNAAARSRKTLSSVGAAAKKLKRPRLKQIPHLRRSPPQRKLPSPASGKKPKKKKAVLLVSVLALLLVAVALANSSLFQSNIAAKAEKRIVGSWNGVLLENETIPSAQKISVALPAPLKRVVRLQFHSQNAPFLIYPST